MYTLSTYVNIGVTTEEQTASSQQSGKNQGIATRYKQQRNNSKIKHHILTFSLSPLYPY